MIRILKLTTYTVMLVITFIAAKFFHNYNLFILLLSLIIIPLLVEILFLLNCNKIKINIYAEKYSVNKNDTIKITINNSKTFVFGFADLNFHIKSIFYDEYSKRYIMPTAFMFTQKTSIPIKFIHSGRYKVYIDNIFVSDIFGIFKKSIPLGKAINIDVMPDIVNNINIISGSSHIDNQWAANNYVAQSGDISGQREYIAGDRLNSIHWKSTAKKDEIMVKEFEKTESDEYILLFDFNRQYLDSSLDNLYSMASELIGLGKSFYVMWLFSGSEDLSVKYISKPRDLKDLINILYSSYPIYDENITINTFRRQYGSSRAIYAGRNEELI